MRKGQSKRKPDKVSPRPQPNQLKTRKSLASANAPLAKPSATSSSQRPRKKESQLRKSAVKQSTSDDRVRESQREQPAEGLRDVYEVSGSALLAAQQQSDLFKSQVQHKLHQQQLQFQKPPDKNLFLPQQSPVKNGKGPQHSHNFVLRKQQKPDFLTRDPITAILLGGDDYKPELLPINDHNQLIDGSHLVSSFKQNKQGIHFQGINMKQAQPSNKSPIVIKDPHKKQQHNMSTLSASSRQKSLSNQPHFNPAQHQKNLIFVGHQGFGPVQKSSTQVAQPSQVGLQIVGNQNNNWQEANVYQPSSVRAHAISKSQNHVTALASQDKKSALIGQNDSARNYRQQQTYVLNQASGVQGVSGAQRPHTGNQRFSEKMIKESQASPAATNQMASKQAALVNLSASIENKKSEMHFMKFQPSPKLVAQHSNSQVQLEEPKRQPVQLKHAQLQQSAPPKRQTDPTLQFPLAQNESHPLTHNSSSVSQIAVGASMSKARKIVSSNKNQLLEQYHANTVKKPGAGEDYHLIFQQPPTQVQKAGVSPGQVFKSKHNSVTTNLQAINSQGRPSRNTPQSIAMTNSRVNPPEPKSASLVGNNTSSSVNKESIRAQPTGFNPSQQNTLNDEHEIFQKNGKQIASLPQPSHFSVSIGQSHGKVHGNSHGSSQQVPSAALAQESTHNPLNFQDLSQAEITYLKAQGVNVQMLQQHTSYRHGTTSNTQSNSALLSGNQTLEKQVLLPSSMLPANVIPSSIHQSQPSNQPRLAEHDLLLSQGRVLKPIGTGQYNVQRHIKNASQNYQLADDYNVSYERYMRQGDQIALNQQAAMNRGSFIAHSKLNHRQSNQSGVMNKQSILIDHQNFMLGSTMQHSGNLPHKQPNVKIKNPQANLTSNMIPRRVPYEEELIKQVRGPFTVDGRELQQQSQSSLMFQKLYGRPEQQMHPTVISGPSHNVIVTQGGGQIDSQGYFHTQQAIHSKSSQLVQALQNMPPPQVAKTNPTYHLVQPPPGTAHYKLDQEHIQTAIQQISEEQEKILKQLIVQNQDLDINHLQQIIQRQINQQSRINTVQLNQASVLHKFAGLQNMINNNDVGAIQLAQMIFQQQALQQLTSASGSRPKKQQTDLYGNPKVEKPKHKIPFENAYVEDCYKFIVMPGNNSQLIRKALEKRHWWIEIQPVHSMFNFRWQPVSSGIRFDRLCGHKQKPGENFGMGNNLTSFNTTLGPQGDGTTVAELNQRQMVNHLENHHLITEKFNLLQVMQKYCDLQKENVFDYMPVTFYVEMPNVQKETAYNAAMLPFLQYFQALEDNKHLISDLKGQLENLHQQEFEQELHDLENPADPDEKLQAEPDKEVALFDSQMHKNGDCLSDLERTRQVKSREQRGLLQAAMGQGTVYKTPGKEKANTKFKSFNFEKRSFSRYTCPVSHFDGFNLWLLKPTHLNRGRGIHVFNDLPTLHKLIKEYCSGKDEESWKKKTKKFMEHDQDEDDPHEDSVESPQKAAMNSTQGISPVKATPSKQPKSGGGGFKIKHNTFIIQKYIERPLLICNRKFDIRVWVLLDHDHNLFMFKEGYIRTSGSEFGIDAADVDNAAVHLTNNAVQKQLDNYGKFEDGNTMSYSRFQQLLEEENSDCEIDIYNDLVPMMKERIIKSIFSVRKTIDPERRKFSFELFGYDFILDENYNVWLIEVNTNPCLEESSQLLRDMLPRMIEDMLKLTVDVVFPKNMKRKKPGSNSQSPIKAKNRKSSIGQRQKNLYRIEEERKLATQEEDQVDPEGEDCISLGPDADPEKIELDKLRKAKKRIYPVDGYADSENMWEKLLNVEKSAQCPPFSQQVTNNRHSYLIQVQEKVFKIKKNPAYIRTKKEQARIDEIKERLAAQSEENLVGLAQSLVEKTELASEEKEAEAQRIVLQGS